MLSFLASLGIGTIASRLAAAWEAREKAKSDAERAAADVKIKRLEAMAQVQASEAGSRINAIMRAALAGAVVVIVWKLLVWDKALGQWTAGRTEALSDLDRQIILAVIGFYFLYEGVTTVARIVKR